VFAGAVRETVFSDPQVIERVQSDFVPVALKAALVNNPPRGREGRLYREIARSRIAPQGICAANDQGQVLAWALTFDDQKSITAFLDHSLKRFRESPGGVTAVSAERYRQFPSRRLEDGAPSPPLPEVATGHREGSRCPAREVLPPGTLAVRLAGRALAPTGEPVQDTVRQEDYVEDRFSVPVSIQEEVGRSLERAGGGRARLPDEFARLCATHAYLGMLDVQPLSNPCGGSSEVKEMDFWAEKAGGPPGSPTWRVGGASEVFTDQMANAGPGDLHRVRLIWEGTLEMEGRRMVRLLLSAKGVEKLRFGSARKGSPEPAASLPAGRSIDMDGAVRFGLLGDS
jgi:hypothetical protein